MIKTTLSIVGLLIGFVLLMSITVNNRPLFSHVYDLISPATKAAQNKTEEFFAQSLAETQAYSKKIFDNSLPKVKDSVKSKFSANKKIGEEPEEKITLEEKQELDQLIKNH
jgi:hypothetical protein